MHTAPGSPTPLGRAVGSPMTSSALEHTAESGVLHVREPEVERLLAGGPRELVDERLDREDILCGGERAERRGPERRRIYVQRHARLRDPVMRKRIPAGGLRAPIGIEVAAGVDV